MELSIIIPAYNASNTLSRAVNSVLSQMNEKTELIIIENGSCDNTAELAQQFSQKYANVVFAQSNKGVSQARNKGMALAKGNYITFLDADDVLSDHAVEQFLKGCQHHLDLYIYKIKMGTRRVTSSGGSVEYRGDTLEQGLSHIISNPTRYMQACASVYRRQIVQDNQLLFDTTMSLSEDSDFTLQFLSFVQSFQTIDNVVYECPGDNKQSITRKSDPKKVDKMIYALEKTAQKSTWLQQSQQLLIAFEQYILMNFNVIMVREVFNRRNKQPFFDRHNQVVTYSQYPLFKQAIQHVQIKKEIKIIRMWPFIFIKLKLTSIASLMFMLRSIQNERAEKN